MAVATGRKQATSANKERRKDENPSSVPLSDNERTGKYNTNDDNHSNVSGDYGIILVKKYRKLRSSSFVEEEPMNTPNHRGIRPNVIKKNEARGGFVDVLTSALCGVCVSEKYVMHEEPSTANTTVSDDSSQQSGNGDTNAILLRQNKFREEEELKQLEESIVTDVSFLTDGSPRDLDVQDVDDEMPSSSNFNTPSALPAFRKPVMRKTKKNEPMPSDLMKHTRKNPLWKEKVGDVFKKTQKDKRRRSSSRRRRRLPLNPNDRPERKRLV